MRYDAIDICTAHYIFASLFHDGQWGNLYAKFAQLDRIGFNPSPLLARPSRLNENAKEIYMQLVRKHIGVNSTLNPRPSRFL